MQASCFYRNLFFFLTCFLLGCAVRSNDVTSTRAFPRTIERAKKEGRHIIMHSGVDTFAVTSVQVERAKKQFTVHLQKLDSLHRAAFGNPAEQVGKYVRITMQDSTSYTLDEPHTLPFSRVRSMALFN